MAKRKSQIQCLCTCLKGLRPQRAPRCGGPIGRLKSKTEGWAHGGEVYWGTSHNRLGARAGKGMNGHPIFSSKLPDLGGAGKREWVKVEESPRKRLLLIVSRVY